MLGLMTLQSFCGRPDDPLGARPVDLVSARPINLSLKERELYPVKFICGFRPTTL